MKLTKFEHPSDQIVEIMNRIYTHGMTTTSGGNLSIMDDEGNLWISPSGVDKGTLKRTDIMCVKPDGTMLGPHKPSCEFPFHQAVYKLRPDVKAIVHAHPPKLVSFSVAGVVPDTMVHAKAREYCGEVGWAPYDIPGSVELGKKVSAALVDGHDTTLLENHGTCCVGQTLLGTFQKFETLDFTARMIHNAMTIGKPHPLTKAQMKDAMADRNGEFKAFTPKKRTSAEMDMRLQMTKMVRRSYEQYLFTSTSGTYAARLDKDTFLVTPCGVDRGTIDPEDMVLVSGCRVEAGKTPSRATWLIKKIFDAQPEISSVILATPPSVMGYALAHEKFDPRVIPESYIALREMPAFHFGAPWKETAKLLKTLSPRYPIVLVENDCVIATGSSLIQAFDRMEVAEYSAQATISAGCMGGLKPIVGKQITDLVRDFHLLP